MEKQKKKYEKPKLEAKKLDTYFFACLKNAHQGCVTIGNKVLGSGCPG